jgi:hypothetical protein
MYCILRTLPDNARKVISIIDSCNDFISTISQTISDEFEIKKILNINTGEYFKFNNTKQDNGYYLLQNKNENKITLVLIKEIIQEGYFWNSKPLKNYENLCTWELIEYQTDLIKSHNFKIKEIIKPKLIKLDKFDLNLIQTDSFVGIIGNSNFEITPILDKYEMENLMIVDLQEFGQTYSFKYPRSTVLNYYEDINTDFFEKNNEPKCLIIKNFPLKNNSYELTLQDLNIISKKNNVAVIITFENINDLKSVYKNFFDFVFLCENNLYSVQKKMFEYFGGVFGDLEEFRGYFGEITKNQGNMVIMKNGNRVNNISNNVFFY